MIFSIIALVLFVISILFFLVCATSFNPKVYNEYRTQAQMLKNRRQSFGGGLMFALGGILVIII